MNKRSLVGIIIEIALIVQCGRAQGGSVSPVPVSSETSPVPRVLAPLTVLGKPIVADFQSTRTMRPGDATKAVEVQLRGRFYRTGNGNTRTDYFDPDPSASADSVAVSMIWSPQSKTMALVSFAERTVRSPQGPPVYPRQDEWMPQGRFVLKFTNEKRTLHGLECRRTSLVPIGDQGTENVRGETWVAFDWGLVMLDVVQTPTEELRWEVVRVDRTEPEPSLFAIPEGFTVTQ